MTNGAELESQDDRLLHRFLFFTDAVFAIVLTLMALELRPPETRLEATAETLAHLTPHIGAFVLSFAITGVFWVSHMNTVRPVSRFDWPTAIANLVYLLPICMLPFATGWLGADMAGAYAFSVYAWVLVAISAANMLLVLVAYRGGGRLIAGGIARGEVLYRLVRAASPGVSFGVGLALLAGGYSTPAHFCWLLIPVVFLAARLFFKPKPAAA